MKIKINTSIGKYDIVVLKHGLSSIPRHFNLERKVLVITDSNIPTSLINKVLSYCKDGHLYILKAGEKSKNINNYRKIMEYLVDNNFTRTDCIVALGGGVVGDIACFVASTFNRGIDFYNIPTSLLAMVDASIGGKSAIDFKGIKNVIGAFYQPSCVLISIDTLKSLPKRQLYNGLCESIKMAATFDSSLFSLIENSNLDDILQEVIIRSIKIKKEVVEKDTKEKGIRKVLNFGHTIGHGIEILAHGKLYHGEAIANGMLYMSSKEVNNRLSNLLDKYNIPHFYEIDKNKLYELLIHDKKATNEYVDAILCEEIGSYKIMKIKIKELIDNYVKF